jgi:hypothetical protein
MPLTYLDGQNKLPIPVDVERGEWARLGFGFQRFNHQMKMVVHQDIGMNAGGEALGRFGQQPQKVKTVGVVAVHSFAAAGLRSSGVCRNG